MAKKTQNAQSSHFHIKTELMLRALDKRFAKNSELTQKDGRGKKTANLVASVTIILFDTTCYLNFTFL